MRLILLLISLVIIGIVVSLQLNEIKSVLHIVSPENSQNINRQLEKTQNQVDKYNRQIEDMQNKTNQAIEGTNK
jgi:uncharacterized membrane-anchored protein YhcB (DUF1043 family)